MTIGQSLSLQGKVTSVVSAHITLAMGGAFGGQERIKGIHSLTWKQGTDGELVKGVNGAYAFANGAFTAEGSMEITNDAFVELIAKLNRKNGGNGWLEVPFGPIQISLAERWVDNTGLLTAARSIEIPLAICPEDDVGTGLADGQKVLVNKLKLVLPRPIYYDGIPAYPDPSNPTNPVDIAAAASISLGLL